MADIRPFPAIRPRSDLADKIAALPYDVYNRAEAKAEVERHPDSFLAIDRAETHFDDSVSTYAPEVYAYAAELMKKRINKGDFLQEGERCYYIYELTMDGRTQAGIAAVASIDDYQNGVIKKHENTRAEKEEDRVRHVSALSAQTGPIFLAFRSNQRIKDIMKVAMNEAPIYDFTSEDGVRHRMFLVEESYQVRELSEAFREMDAIYIADGHHRCASAVRVGLEKRRAHPDYTGEEEFNYFLSVLFPDEELKILDYNRVVKDLGGRTPEAFLQEIKDRFVVGAPSKEAIRPEEKGSFSMYLDGLWYPVKVREEDRSEDAVEGLDVSCLQRLLLDPVLNIKDPKTDNRIDFVGGIRGLSELERRCHTDMAVAFAMYPTSISELFRVADEGRLMPPKSTWFEPKLRSGLLIHEI